jgi:tetratricopeptide (TPR) repeat protein
MATDYNNIGKLLHDEESRLDEALGYHKEALGIDEKASDKEGMARDYNEIGAVLRTQGMYNESLKNYEKSIDIHKNLNKIKELGNDYYCMNFTYSKLGEYDKSLDLLYKALEIHKDKDEEAIAKDYGGIGIVYREMKEYSKALDYHTNAFEIHDKLKDNVRMAEDLYYKSLVYDDLRNEKESLNCLCAAKEILEKFTRDTKSNHPLIDKVNEQISKLKQDKYV